LQQIFFGNPEDLGKRGKVLEFRTRNVEFRMRRRKKAMARVYEQTFKNIQKLTKIIPKFTKTISKSIKTILKCLKRFDNFGKLPALLNNSKVQIRVAQINTSSYDIQVRAERRTEESEYEMVPNHNTAERRG
jgi:hypothetical protein